MRVCDVIAQYIVKKGIKNVFMVAGGGSMFLTDGLACNDEIIAIPCHHEQAASFAAVAYGKYKGLGCCYVTTGCGGTNAITGVLQAWQDGVNCIFVSGQCRQNETIYATDVPIRQMGLQEADIVNIVKPITKYAVILTEASKVLYELEKMWAIMEEGRGGPVWLDVPLDVQKAEVNPNTLQHYIKGEKQSYNTITEEELTNVISMLNEAHKPIILVGGGLRQSGAVTELEKFAETWNIPVVSSRMGVDAIKGNSVCNIGRIGNRGTRAANMAIQSADLILNIGCRMSLGTIGYQTELFGMGAKIVCIDIDRYEHLKGTVTVDYFINADAGAFLRLMNTAKNNLEQKKKNDNRKWLNHLNELKRRFCLTKSDSTYNGVSMYEFIPALSDCLRRDDVVVTDTGSIGFALAQTINLTQDGQRFIINGAQSEMGFALPGSVGIVSDRINQSNKDVVCVVGDGSLQMNIQEFQTVAHHQYRIKTFVWNNGSYCSIRLQQRGTFKGRFLGCDKESGVSFPNLEKIAYAYGIRYCSIHKGEDCADIIQNVLALEEPVICEVFGEIDEEVSPIVKISKILDDGQTIYNPLERMHPLIDEEELVSIMEWKLDE